MDDLQSHISRCRELMRDAHEKYRIPRKWQISPAMWAEIRLEVKPDMINFAPYIPTVTLFGLPVVVDTEYPGITLQVI